MTKLRLCGWNMEEDPARSGTPITKNLGDEEEDAVRNEAPTLMGKLNLNEAPTNEEKLRLLLMLEEGKSSIEGEKRNNLHRSRKSSSGC